jgi:queuine tRNA-ribosyltransferase
MIDQAPASPDLVFYDMFSRKVSADAWTLETFRKLFAACAGRDAELFTYSCSTSVRVALLGAGFYVAQGRSIGAKEETTIGLTPQAFCARWADRDEVLSADWLKRWNRSGAKFPLGLPLDAQAAFENSIREHAQFKRACAGAVEG